MPQDCRGGCRVYIKEGGGGGFGMNTGKGSIICRGGRIFEVLDMNRTLHANYSYSKIINYSAFLIK